MQFSKRQQMVKMPVPPHTRGKLAQPNIMNTIMLSKKKCGSCGGAK